MLHYKSISEWFQAWGLPAPDHPLISVLQVDVARTMHAGESLSSFCDFYCIALKRVTGAEELKLKYGQQPYDFNQGILSFVSPGQVTGMTVEKDVEVRQCGWYLVLHPDFLWNTPLASSMRRYEFWDYALSEALFVSEKEEEIVIGILQNIRHETQSNLDKFSKQIIVSQVGSLLNYSERFYNRQFITREKSGHSILDRLEKALNEYIVGGQATAKGLPTVTDIAALLHISPKYLSGLLRIHTGQSTQHYIHDKLIGRAREQLSTTELSISEIAYELGFEHVQSFSRLFRAKAGLSPLEFRRGVRD